MPMKSEIGLDDEITVYAYGSTLEMSNSIGSPVVIRDKDDREPKIKLDQTGKKTSTTRKKVDMTRKANPESLHRTFQRLRRMVNANFLGGDNQLWVTLTYAENVRDTEKVYKDFKVFLKKVRRRYENLEYINVLEPQKRGAWHMHVMLKTDKGSKLYISNEEMSKLWGHGFVRVQRLNESDNIGAYLTAYLTDMEYDGDDDTEGRKVELKNGKAIEKGARLDMYPANMQIYRASRGIRRPKSIRTTKRALLEAMGLEMPPEPSNEYIKSMQVYDEVLDKKVDSEDIFYIKQFYDIEPREEWEEILCERLAYVRSKTESSTQDTVLRERWGLVSERLTAITERTRILKEMLSTQEIEEYIRGHKSMK